VRLGLVDASSGKIGTPIDHVLLFCYQYDPTLATYSASILRMVRLGGILTIVCLVGGILIFRRRDAAQISNRRGQALSKLGERGAH
jgi:protein SCO1/2